VAALNPNFYFTFSKKKNRSSPREASTCMQGGKTVKRQEAVKQAGKNKNTPLEV
jgi:hypothetical protein